MDINILVVILAFLAGVSGFYFYNKTQKEKGKKEKEEKPQVTQPKPQITHDAQTRSREIIADAKEEALKIKRDAEEKALKLRSEALDIEKRISQRQEEIDKKASSIEEKTKALSSKEKEIEKQREDLVARLEKIAGFSKEEARKIVLENVESSLKEEIGKKIKDAQSEIHAQSQEKAKEILVEAMQHGYTDWVPEYTISTIKLPNEDIKGRIIGKEGRNIRAFEQVTGVDIELGDEEAPLEVRVSSFDPVRREIARISLERLIRDQRIQPERIEKEVARAKSEIERDMSDAGRKALHEAGIHNVHDQEILDMIGRLKFRTSYGQNQMISSIEAAKIADQIAAEIGADRNIAKLGAFFHDIGKAITDQEGTHVQLGSQFLTKKGFPKEVVDCVAQHHEDEPFTSTEAVIVHLADAVSSSRPGARQESVVEYAKRLSDIEERAKSFKGVKEAYAIAAGREVRVIVSPDEVDDASVEKLSRDIAQKLEKELTYPGQIKVNTIRERRATAYAS